MSDEVRFMEDGQPLIDPLCRSTVVLCIIVDDFFNDRAFVWSMDLLIARGIQALNDPIPQCVLIVITAYSSTGLN